MSGHRVCRADPVRPAGGHPCRPSSFASLRASPSVGRGRCGPVPRRSVDAHPAAPGRLGASGIPPRRCGNRPTSSREARSAAACGPSARAGRPAGVRGDPVQPGAHGGPVLQGRVRPPRARAGLLDDVLGLVEGAEHAVAVRQQLAPEAGGGVGEVPGDRRRGRFVPLGGRVGVCRHGGTDRRTARQASLARAPDRPPLPACGHVPSAVTCRRAVRTSRAPPRRRPPS